MPQAHSLARQAALLFRYALLGVFAVVVFGGGLSARPREQTPLGFNAAHAASGIMSAPGYLCLTTKMNGNFYVIDANRQVILGYTLANDKLRFTSARKFDQDARIHDTSLLPAGSNDGLTVEQAEAFAKKTEPFFNDLAEKMR